MKTIHPEGTDEPAGGGLAANHLMPDSGGGGGGGGCTEAAPAAVTPFNNHHHHCQDDDGTTTINKTPQRLLLADNCKEVAPHQPGHKDGRQLTRCHSDSREEPSSSLLDHSNVLDELIRRANSSWELTMSKSSARRASVQPPSEDSNPNGGSWFRTWPERGRLLGLEEGRSESAASESESVRERAGSDPLPQNGVKRKGRSVPVSDLLRCVPLAYSPRTRQLTLLAEESPTSNSVPVEDKCNDSDEGFGILQSGSDSPSMLSLQSESLSVQGEVTPQKRSITAILKRALLPWRLGKSSGNKDEQSGMMASSMGLILQDRPPPLPPKPTHEMQKHHEEHENMMARARKKELVDANKRQKKHEQRLREEEQMAASAKVWVTEILPNWDQARRTSKVQELWWQGLPPCVRGRIWRLAIGNELNVTPELYRFLVLRAEERLHISESESSSLSEAAGDSSPNGGSGCVESSAELIRMDVSRTFPQLGIFQKGGPYHELLRRVLGAYACMRPDVGYVQGMSFLAAVLLLNLDEEDAFAALANLLNRPLQQTLFRMDQPVMRVYYERFEGCLAQHLPNLHDHLTRLGLTPDLYLPDWLYTVFARSLPLDLACRVWDIFLRDGDRFLFRTALGLLRILEPELSQLDFIQGAQILNKLPEDLNPDKLFRVIRKLRLKDLVLPSAYSSSLSVSTTSLNHPDLPRSRIS